MPVVLAIETSQRTGGVALRAADGKVLVERFGEDGRLDARLMPSIARLFEAAGLTPQELDAVGVSIGPGGFTGLRIAVTTAKMLAEALAAEVIAIPSALVAANSVPASEVAGARRLLVTAASKGDATWVTTLRRSGIRGGIDEPAYGWEVQATPGLQTAERIDLAGIDVLLGDRYLPDPIRQACVSRDVAVIEPAFDPAVCLHISEARLAQGETADPLSLLPLYAREPEAVRRWHAGGSD